MRSSSAHLAPAAGPSTATYQVAKWTASDLVPRRRAHFDGTKRASVSGRDLRLVIRQSVSRSELHKRHSGRDGVEEAAAGRDRTI